jgi:hypothetical protein
MNQLILQFSYLQVLDFLTTIAFLLNGVREANPLVKTAIAVSASPIAGLVAVKILAVMLGLYCWRVGKHALLARTNVLFAALIAWNLVALIIRSAA